MVGWDHWLDGHEFEQAPGVGDEQGSLVCFSPWGNKESDVTEWLNWTDNQNDPLIHGLKEWMLCSQVYQQHLSHCTSPSVLLGDQERNLFFLSSNSQQ